MVFFASRFLWNGLIRFLLFWAVFAVTLGILSRFWTWIDFQLLQETISHSVLTGEISQLSTQEFAFALAALLGATAISLGVAYTVLHTILLALSLSGVRRRIARTADMADFAANYETIHARLSRHALLSHAWKEFDETLVPPEQSGGFYRNTVRPQTFINMSVLREQLFGLKLISAIPGYFVGIGLLLTFIGLVLALNEAATAVTAADASGMQDATRRLLQVATFKFATSIAGLGASILLSFWFRLLLSIIEGRLELLCKTIEQKLRYTAPQSITAQMNETLAGQLTELKQINSADFFSRMGESLSPQIQSALSVAMAPVSQSIDEAVSKLADNSQNGMTDLAKSFRQTLQEGAGTEMRELAATLQNMQTALMEVQRGLNSSGEDFGRRMADAAEHLNKLVSDASERLDASSEQSRQSMVDVVSALRETLEQANRKVEEGLGQAASGASEKIEAAMSGIFGKLESQIGSFTGGLGLFQQQMANQLEETQGKVATAQVGAAEAIGTASAHAASALQEGLGQALATIREEIDRFVDALRQSQTSFAAQNNSIRETTDQSRAVADAFSRTAQEVRGASGPLVQAGERIAAATDKMATTIAQSADALEAGLSAARSLSEAIAEHHDQLSNAMALHSDRFESADSSLAEAVQKLRDGTQQQMEIIAQYAQQVDKGFAEAVGKLNGLLSGLEDNTQELGESVENLRSALTLQAAE